MEVLYMFSGIDFNEDTVGMAHIKTMCSGASSSGVNMFSFSPEELASVMAHEMGHTFGLTHDDDSKM
jgi:predicted Zn-dependent protease